MSASNRFPWKHCLALTAALLLPVWASSALSGPAASLTGSGVEVPAPQPSSLTVPAGEELGRRNLGHIVRTVPARKGLAVIADFADARLEDWRGPGIRSVAQLRTQLQHRHRQDMLRQSEPGAPEERLLTPPINAPA